MLKNLLRPKWRHPDAAARRQAIEEGELESDVLFELAKTDPDAGVRASAVSRMQDLQQVIAVAKYRRDPADAGVPARLHDLILAADPRAVPDTQTLQRCYELCSGQPRRRSFLAHAPYAALRLMAVQGIHQDEALEQCVLSDKSNEVRRAALSRIDNEETLRRIAKQLRGRDKSTARRAHEMCAQRQAQRDRAEQRRRLLTVLQAFAEETKPLSEAAIDQHVRQWKSISDDANEGEQNHFEALQAVLQPQLAKHRHRREEEREWQSLRERILQDLTELAEQSRQLDPGESEQRLLASEARWRELPAMRAPAAQQHFEQDFRQSVRSVRGVIRVRREQIKVQQRLDSVIAGLETRLQANSLSARNIQEAREQRDSLLAGIEDRPAFEKSLQRIRNLVEKLEQKLAAQQAREQACRQQLKSHLDALESSLRANALKPALAAHKKAHNLLIAVGDPRPASLRGLEERLRHSESTLRELKSWRNWGTDHAREELIKEALELRDAPPADVEALAKRLRDLRGRWRMLGPLEPGGKAHWEQFDTACTQAHGPVKAKRDVEAETRRGHLEERRKLCQELEELIANTDWEQPDWRALDKAMSETRRQWRKLGGVPHKAWPVIRKRFDRAVKGLDRLLDEERQRNFHYRQGLVRKVEALAQEPDSRAATAAARNLRQEWRVTVHSPSRQENQLWQAFNTAMDSVFRKDRAARDQFKVALAESQHKAEALCDQLEKLGQADDKTVWTRRAELRQVADQFAALESLPGPARRPLENRFDQACKALEQRINRAGEALRGEQLEQLYALHRLCVQMEENALGEEPDAQTASVFETQWAAAEKPAGEKPALLGLERRFQAVLAVIRGEQATNALGDLAANAARKRGICTDLEILLGVESPPAEHSQRMQRQIERLKSAMQGGDQGPPGRIRELRLAYLSCGPVKPLLQAGLEKRFLALFAGERQRR
ncbi:MAG: DUF349 domain-containing protein [Pseudomonadota bacterium]|nr:DUF349 domain-containing protein [Pseudomonadota bacterium]